MHFINVSADKMVRADLRGCQYVKHQELSFLPHAEKHYTYENAL
jgi:hypothetical protein